MKRRRGFNAHLMTPAEGWERPHLHSPLSLQSAEKPGVFRTVQRALQSISRLAKRPFQSSLRPNSPALQHLDETQLLAHLDGELSGEMRQQVVDHLQSCWSCRGHFRELCSRVEAYILSRENELPDPLSDSDRRIRELRQRLARAMETLPSK
jgi:hypothetical protein